MRSPVHTTSRILLLHDTIENPNDEPREETPPSSCYEKLKKLVSCLVVCRKENLYMDTREILTDSIKNNISILDADVESKITIILTGGDNGPEDYSRRKKSYE